MTFHRPSRAVAASALALAPLLSVSAPALAHKLRLRGEAVTVAGAQVTVTPSRDWNSLSRKLGKYAETWTLDGEQLNDVTFFGGVPAGEPLFREKSKKHAPLPKFLKTTLLVEVPELLEGTYRAYKNSGTFKLLSTEPGQFLGRDGVFFTYEYTDEDQLVRKGEARATIVNGQLYMATFDAPRLNYFDQTASDFRSLAGSATLR